MRHTILTTLVSLVVFNGFTGLAHAQSDPTAVEFPMIGIGFDQTLQLNVISLPSSPCAMQLAIFDSNGATVATVSVPPPETLKITYNSINFDYKNQVSRFPQRKEFRPEVILTPPAGVAPSACQAQATAEVFDNFARTDWVLTPGLVPPGPQTMPIYLGPVGLIFEQTARLNVVAHPPNPCIGTIGFIDTSGNPIGSPMPVSLTPNQATFIDLTGLQAGIALGSERPEVIGAFTPNPTTAPGVCIPSVEVFDQLSGYTRLLVPPGSPVIPAPSQ
jgi:hypothetical protein